MVEIAAKESINKLCAKLNLDVMDTNYAYGFMVLPMFRVRYDDYDRWFTSSCYEIQVYDRSDNSWEHYYGSDNPMNIKRQLRAMSLMSREIVYNAIMPY